MSLGFNLLASRFRGHVISFRESSPVRTFYIFVVDKCLKLAGVMPC
jgi:hypothetical protein